jgi:hypothetical protein
MVNKNPLTPLYIIPQLCAKQYMNCERDETKPKALLSEQLLHSDELKKFKQVTKW